MQRNSQLFSGYRINPVEDFTIYTGFTCLSPNDADRDLDNFIRQDAQRHRVDKIAVTSPIIDLVATEINLNSLPDKVVPTADGRVAIAFKTDENTPHRAVPAGILVAGSNNIAHFVPINVVTNLIAGYLISKSSC